MKLYALMHKEYKTLARNCAGFLGSSMDEGLRVFVTRKAAKKHLHPNYRIVVFETSDQGSDARRKETWK